MPHCHLIRYKSHMTKAVIETGIPRGEPASNSLNYGTDSQIKMEFVDYFVGYAPYRQRSF
jgi:hypothetical protein